MQVAAIGALVRRSDFAWRALQPVVDLFGDGEEAVVWRECVPVRVHANILKEGYQRSEDFGDTPAVSGRIDVRDSQPPQRRGHRLDARQQCGVSMSLVRHQAHRRSLDRLQHGLQLLTRLIDVPSRCTLRAWRCQGESPGLSGTDCASLV